MDEEYNLGISQDTLFLDFFMNSNLTSFGSRLTVSFFIQRYNDINIKLKLRKIPQKYEYFRYINLKIQIV